MISLELAISWMISALLGGAGLIGLLMMKPKHDLEKRIQQTEEDRRRLNAVDKMQDYIDAIEEEQTIQCYCILACLKGLAEQGCNGPVHDGIEKMEKHLNKKAHSK